MQRRGVLAGVATGLIGLAGCTGGSRTFREAEDPWRDATTEQSDGSSTFSGRAVVPRGTYATQQFRIQSQVTFRLEASVASGEPIDFVTMERSEFANWAEASDYVYVKNASAMASATASLDTPLAAGDYVHVLDNTYGAEAAAGPERTVSFELTLSAESGGKTRRVGAVGGAKGL